MAGATGPEAGEVVTCAGCGQDVKKKSMIPVLQADGATGLVCVACARTHVVKQPG